MQFPVAARLLALPLLLSLAACGDDSTGLGGGNLEGSWSLVTINGQPLPIVDRFEDPDFGACTITLDRMGMDFSDGDYQMMLVSTTGCPGEQSETFTDNFFGTYRTTGGRLYTLDEESEGEETMLQYEVRGDRLTLRNTAGGSPVTWVLQRD